MAALPAAAAAGAFAPAATYDAAAVATVVAHAAARGIRVVPEFDTPAHAGGFLVAASAVAFHVSAVSGAAHFARKDSRTPLLTVLVAGLANGAKPFGL